MVGSDTDLLSKQRHRSDPHLFSLWRGDGLGGGPCPHRGKDTRAPWSLFAVQKPNWSDKPWWGTP